jgi:energy-converting hydrogenase Eha subunit H
MIAPSAIGSAGCVGVFLAVALYKIISDTKHCHQTEHKSRNNKSVATKSREEPSDIPIAVSCAIASVVAIIYGDGVTFLRFNDRNASFISSDAY